MFDEIEKNNYFIIWILSKNLRREKQLHEGALYSAYIQTLTLFCGKRRTMVFNCVKLPMRNARRKMFHYHCSEYCLRIVYSRRFRKRPPREFEKVVVTRAGRVRE